MNLQEILSNLVRHAGPEVLGDRRRLLGLVADHYPAAKEQHWLLEVAFRADVIERLRQDGSEHAQQQARQRFTKQFKIDQAEAAQFVAELAAALHHPEVTGAAHPAGPAKLNPLDGADQAKGPRILPGLDFLGRTRRRWMAAGVSALLAGGLAWAKLPALLKAFAPQKPAPKKAPPVSHQSLAPSKPPTPPKPAPSKPAPSKPAPPKPAAPSKPIPPKPTPPTPNKPAKQPAKPPRKPEPPSHPPKR
jgi:hypothetical protein